MRIEGNDQRLAVAAATQMQQTGQQQVVAPKTPQHQDARDGSKADAVQSFGGDKVAIKVELPQNTVDTLQRMGNISDFLNSVATNLRQTNEGLTAASAVVEQMKTTLDNVVKNYPPYPVDSQGRMEQLMNYSALKKQIQGLMVPAPPQPAYEKVKHLWEGLTSGVGHSIQVPSLPQDAPESHIRAASKQLEAISSQINLVRETMSNSIMRS
jgi:hypothetical protein